MSEKINEARHQVKRKYGDHARIRINEKGAAVRDTIIKYIGKNYVQEQDLNNYLVRLEEDRGSGKINKPAWFKRNQKFFNTFEKNDTRYYSLSKYGQRVLELIKQDKKTPPAINESTLSNIPSLSEWVSVHEGVSNFDDAYWHIDKWLNLDYGSPKETDALYDEWNELVQKGKAKDIQDFIESYADEDQLYRYGIVSKDMKKFAKYIADSQRS